MIYTLFILYGKKIDQLTIKKTAGINLCGDNKIFQD